MIIGNKYCTVCGKEKQMKYIGFTNQYIYVNCKCEDDRNRAIEDEKRRKAISRGVELLTRSSHIPPVCIDASFDTMTVDEHNQKAVNAARYILDALKNNTSRDKNSLVLQGNRGSGKTYIACGVLNDFNGAFEFSEGKIKALVKERENGFKKGEYASVISPCKFITETDLFALYFDNFNYCKTDSPIDEYKKAPKLLVIDDAGSCYGDKNRIQGMYNSIIDYRYSNHLSTIVTTNLSRKELLTYMGERAFDRLQSDCYFVDLTIPESRRLRK